MKATLYVVVATLLVAAQAQQGQHDAPRDLVAVQQQQEAPVAATTAVQIDELVEKVDKVVEKLVKLHEELDEMTHEEPWTVRVDKFRVSRSFIYQHLMYMCSLAYIQGHI
jgi:uncharacterized membrane protein